MSSCGEIKNTWNTIDAFINIFMGVWLQVKTASPLEGSLCL